MSYNCDTFKVKEIENLRIPLSSFYMSEHTDWHPERINHDDGSVELSYCESSLSGSIEGDIFICHSLNCSGEDSGTFINLILEPALKTSTGKLIASCIWEGGDSINRLIVNDGLVSWEVIEI